MFVELDMFSGRPNPHWQLGAGDRDALLGLQRGLARAAAAPPEPPALGYRGFLYAAPGGECRAFGGHVVTPGGPLADPARSVERFLIGRLPPEFAGLRSILAGML